MVSVITVTYNRAVLLSETIQSVLGQSFTDFEYVIIDDGSTDNTEDTVKSFNDSRVKYNKGAHIGWISKLRNAGLNECNGDYIIFIDSDDLWKPNALETMIKSIKSSEADFVFSDAEGFNDTGIFVKSIYGAEKKNDPGRNFFIELISEPEFFILTPCILFKRTCLQKSGVFNEKISISEKDLWCRMAHECNGILIPEVLASIRRHEANTTVEVAPEILEFEIYSLRNYQNRGWITQKQFDTLTKPYIRKLGDYFYKQKDYKAAKGYYKQLNDVASIGKYILCGLH